MHQDTSKPRISLLFAMAQVMLTDVSATEVTVKPVTDGSSAESMRGKKVSLVDNQWGYRRQMRLMVMKYLRKEIYL